MIVTSGATVMDLAVIRTALVTMGGREPHVKNVYARMAQRGRSTPLVTGYMHMLNARSVVFVIATQAFANVLINTTERHVDELYAQIIAMTEGGVR